jgi:hypothetical protein
MIINPFTGMVINACSAGKKKKKKMMVDNKESTKRLIKDFQTQDRARAQKAVKTMSKTGGSVKQLYQVSRDVAAKGLKKVRKMGQYR